MRILASVAVALVMGSLETTAAAPQTLSNDQFQVGYSSYGVTSIKHVKDKYDTDYIAAGRTLGSDDSVSRDRGKGLEDRISSCD